MASSSLSRDAWRRLRSNHIAILSLTILLVIVLACALLPALPQGLLGETVARATHDWVRDPNLQTLANRNLPPSSEHWFGTDQLGRDLFSRTLYGGRISILVGVVATFVSVSIGVCWGAIAGYVGGRTDALMMRIVDILYALPFLVIVILLSETLGAWTNQLSDTAIHWLAGNDLSKIKDLRTKLEPIFTLLPLFIAIGALSWLTVSRIVRVQVQTVKSQEYIEAARSLGLSHPRILFRHILPNTLGPIIVYTTLTIPSIMLFEATLSFLGLGVKDPNSSWGVLIKDGANAMFSNPSSLLFPACIFSLTLLSLNFLGDGLRDALDPKSEK